MSLVAKSLFISAGILICSNAIAAESTDRHLRILVAGQSISSNCNQHRFGPEAGVFQVSKDGLEIEARDPLQWADCDGGSIWLPLGKRIIESGMAQKVTFMSIGVGGTSVHDWRPGGRAYAKLQSAFKLIEDKKIRFDYGFWLQGSSDIGSDPIRYENALKDLVRELRQTSGARDWLIAIHSSCFGQSDNRIAQAQERLARNALHGYFKGPDINSIEKGLRTDSCHLNKAGQEVAAGLWFKALQDAQRTDHVTEEETLLRFFR
ncbi:sialate O-acetylesterase [Uliginosibacterium paludis]|uniref:Sialate O-acetylesterase n=1 Tax=Uliginosibacterium paludis TaxID=1615952 RepID=A0ABV2CUW4_9RHOO